MGAPMPSAWAISRPRRSALERARQLQALDAQIGALESEVERLLPAQRPVYRRGR
jgi:hypothetical protein